MADVIALSTAASDICRFQKSKSVSTVDNDGNRVFVLQVQRKSFLKDLWIQVQTGFTAASTGTVTVGIKTPDLDSVNYFMTDAEVASEVTGFKACIAANRGYYFEKGGTITVSLAKGTSVADVVCRVFADLSPIF